MEVLESRAWFKRIMIALATLFVIISLVFFFIDLGKSTLFVSVVQILIAPVAVAGCVVLYKFGLIAMDKIYKFGEKNIIIKNDGNKIRIPYESVESANYYERKRFGICTGFGYLKVIFKDTNGACRVLAMDISKKEAKCIAEKIKQINIIV